MGFCKENLCKSFSCRESDCVVRDGLKEALKFQNCKGNCQWIQEGINGVNACKDASCAVGQTIVEFRKEKPIAKKDLNII